jgi:dienelactone hydrolase
VDGMVEDWTATLDCISDLEFIDAGRVAYIGFSMGTRFGLPYVAAAGDRLRCAALGKNGLETRVAARAPGPRRQQVQKGRSQDQDASAFSHAMGRRAFSRESQCELFDLIGSEDKRMISFPGPHARSAPESIGLWCAFIERSLNA